MVKRNSYVPTSWNANCLSPQQRGKAASYLNVKMGRDNVSRRCLPAFIFRIVCGREEMLSAISPRSLPTQSKRRALQGRGGRRGPLEQRPLHGVCVSLQTSVRLQPRADLGGTGEAQSCAPSCQDSIFGPDFKSCDTICSGKRGGSSGTIRQKLSPGFKTQLNPPLLCWDLAPHGPPSPAHCG